MNAQHFAMVQCRANGTSLVIRGASESSGRKEKDPMNANCPKCAGCRRNADLRISIGERRSRCGRYINAAETFDICAACFAMSPCDESGIPFVIVREYTSR